MNVLVRKPEEKIPFGISRREWEDKIKIKDVRVWSGFI
jgi:hypothetical protein